MPSRAEGEAQIVALEDYFNQNGKPPPADHPGYQMFRRWQDSEFHCEGGFVRLHLLDQLFPDNYYILNTRSLYDYLASLYNHMKRSQRVPHPSGKPRLAPTVNFLRERIIDRETYHQEVLDYFQGRDNFAVVDIAKDSTEAVLAVLQTATKHPFKSLHNSNIHKTKNEYDPRPAPVEAALEQHGIPPSEWHRPLL